MLPLRTNLRRMKIQAVHLDRMQRLILLLHLHYTILRRFFQPLSPNSLIVRRKKHQHGTWCHAEGIGLAAFLRKENKKTDKQAQVSLRNADSVSVKKQSFFLKSMENRLTNRRRSAIIYRSSASVAQLVEQLIRNQQVAGPSPATSSRCEKP